MSRVSIVIATHNRCTLLPRSIESARQSGNDVEIIVVDDASSDQTSAICEGMEDIQYIRALRRLGLGGARNLGIVAGTSEYISFLDDDDIRLPGSIDAQVSLLEAQPDAGFVYGRVQYGNDQFKEDAQHYPSQCPEGDIFWELMRWNFVPCPSVVFRRECLKRVGLLDEEAAGLEDWDLWVRIAELYKAVATDQSVAVWRQPTLDSKQFTSRPEKMHRIARRLHWEKWLRLPRASERSGADRRELTRAFAERASDQLVWEASDRIKARRLPEVARVLSTLLRLYPLIGSKRAIEACARRFLKPTLKGA